MREVAERLGVGRAEIGAQGALALALLTSYFLLPTYQLTSTIYFQSVNGLGLEIDFMGHRTHLLLASSLASATMFAISGLAPIFWRSKYSLYLSTLAASLGTSLTFSTLVFRERYFSYNGFSILPTVDGAFYVRVPLTQELGPPLYLSAVLLGLTVMNSWTGGRWIPWGKEPLIDRVVSQVVRGISLTR
ncbi:hypothetical protein HS1genome_1419 [Sulfodiicoccus acidiphilus]|uniref:Uncharacterized protein n=1 Tax=Sulfodiicoccus acidiphilus TaxID=1670455 RepID=A0A348B4C8_9CREN|nr:hypothetical protein [Sulfodiicoccus acidiphilus]BBD73030.1 hypothetical protein HS1genome_1419 [Sulfodiicoccus acidiphilus]